MSGFSGVGKVSAYLRTPAGNPSSGWDWGEVSRLSLSQQQNVEERNTSRDPSRTPVRRLPQNTASTIEMVSDEWNKKNVARACGGRIETVAAATDKTYTLPTGVAVGDELILPDKAISNLVVTDSTGSPKTLVLGTNYEVLDPFAGRIKLLNLTTGGAFVQPLHTEYDIAATTVITGLTEGEVDLWLQMAGINTDTGEKGVLDIFRVRFAVAEVIEWLNTGYADFTYKGTALADPTKTPTGPGGNVYKFTTVSTFA